MMKRIEMLLETFALETFTLVIVHVIFQFAFLFYLACFPMNDLHGD